MGVSFLTTRPPLLIQGRDSAIPSLEDIIWGGPIGSTTSPAQPKPTFDDHVDKLAHQLQVSSNYNTFIFYQYILYLYTKIFITPDTSRIYTDTLKGIITIIRNALDNPQLTDTTLRTLCRTQPFGPDPIGTTLANNIVILRNRLNPNVVYPGSDDIINIVHAIYSTRPVVSTNITLYKIKLIGIEGHDLPTLGLESTTRTVSLDTTQYTTNSDLLWKFIYSLNIGKNIKGNGDLNFYLYLLASLALPLDPLELVNSQRVNLYNNERTGVPFLNYLAMLLKQRSLGYNYILSRLADPRRRLMNQLHRFCGVGATCIRDAIQTRSLISLIEETIGSSGTSPLSKEERDIFNQLESSVNAAGVPFTREISYRAEFGDSSEAFRGVRIAAQKKNDDTGEFPDDPTPPEEDPTKPSKKPVKDPKKQPGDKPDKNNTPADGPTSPSDAEEPSNPPQTDDDTIGQSSDKESAVNSESKFLPLALPTENIDDHLYRLAVLRFVSNLDASPNPNITPESLNVLRAWCGALLFIASAETTRKLLTQLKLTGKLKEFNK